MALDGDAPDVGEEAEENSVEYWQTKARLMAVLLDLLWKDAHPVYGTTSKWRGGIGGAAMTGHCSVHEGAPPGEQWILDAVFREGSTVLAKVSREELFAIKDELREKYDQGE